MLKHYQQPLLTAYRQTLTAVAAHCYKRRTKQQSLLTETNTTSSPCSQSLLSATRDKHYQQSLLTANRGKHCKQALLTVIKGKHYQPRLLIANMRKHYQQSLLTAYRDKHY